MRKLDVIAPELVVGGLNWALAGAARFDLVAAIFSMRFGETSVLSSLVYLLVGLSALYQAVSWKAIQRRWSANPQLHLREPLSDVSVSADHLAQRPLPTRWTRPERLCGIAWAIVGKHESSARLN